MCGAALSEPLGEALRRHSRYAPYAGRYAQHVAYAHERDMDTAPYVYAAIPLHAPVPVLRVLSPTPLARERARAPSAHHPVYARAPYADEYARTPYADEYAAVAHDYDASYETPQYATYASRYQAPQLYAAASSAAEEPSILYARPSPGGGYTYRSAAPAPPPRAPAPDASPYIIRVHKYRITKER